MEPTTQLNDQLSDFDKPAIYSRNAVRGFAIFFSAIFGGVLLMQNLNGIGKPQEGRTALGISILITICQVAIGALVGQRATSTGIIISILGASVLSEFVYKKYIPNEVEYSKRSIWKPLIVGLIIFIPLIAFIIYANPQGTNQ
jgi:hypothetical protein